MQVITRRIDEEVLAGDPNDPFVRIRVVNITPDRVRLRITTDVTATHDTVLRESQSLTIESQAPSRVSAPKLRVFVATIKSDRVRLALEGDGRMEFHRGV